VVGRRGRRRASPTRSCTDEITTETFCGLTDPLRGHSGTLAQVSVLLPAGRALYPSRSLEPISAVAHRACRPCSPPRSPSDGNDTPLRWLAASRRRCPLRPHSGQQSRRLSRTLRAPARLLFSHCDRSDCDREHESSSSDPPTQDRRRRHDALGWERGDHPLGDRARSYSSSSQYSTAGPGLANMMSSSLASFARTFPVSRYSMTSPGLIEESMRTRIGEPVRLMI
jgi:hypothetical protein